jgi:VWFA-related protein
MRYRCLLAALTVTLGLLAADQCLARRQTNSPTVRSESTVVLGPTLVKARAGDIVHGLTAKDFVVEDNGIEQAVRLDDSPDSTSFSIVVAVEVGRDATLLFPASEKTAKHAPAEAPLTGLGTMIEAFVGQTKADVAVVAFDSQVRLVQGFSEDIPMVAGKLDRLGPGDGGAAILDAVSYSARLLYGRAVNDRRVLILISETRDQGSHLAKIPNLVQEIGLSNTLVYGLAFSPARAQFFHDLHEQPKRNTDPNLLAPLMIAANGMRNNAAKTLALLAGGEYATFTSARSFDEHLEAFAGDDRDRYLLTFQPAKPKPGPHRIAVRLRSANSGFTVTARTMYWSVANATQ